MDKADLIAMDVAVALPSKTAQFEKTKAKTRRPKVKRAVSLPLSVGEKLRRTRQKFGIDLLQAESQTLIRAKYLEAIETSRFYELPSFVYTLGFVQTYAAYLKLNPKKIVRQFQEEYGPVNRSSIQHLSYQSKLKSARVIITSKFVWVGLIVLFALVITGYLGWQVYALSGLPSLQLDRPVQLAEMAGPMIEVTGHTDPGAKVMVGSEIIPVDENGQFDQEIAAGDAGVHTISVTAESRGQKKRTITRSFKVGEAVQPGQ